MLTMLTCIVFGILLMIAGCATGGPIADTTLLNSVDLVRMTDQIAASLDSSDAALEGAVIVTDRVVNRTNHIMDSGEKELFLARLRAHLAQKDALRARNVRFVVNPGQRPEALPPLEEPLEPGRDVHERAPAIAGGPTHALTATFYTLTNIDRRAREDTYECAFQLLHLQSRAIVWEDAYRVRYTVERGRFE